jgi:hypothetical protein
MKILFNDEENESYITLGVEKNGNLSIQAGEKEPLVIIELQLNEAYNLQRHLEIFIRQIEDTERKKLPWHKRWF